MALYEGVIRKLSLVYGVYYSNVYTIQEASSLEALDVLNAIEGHEIAVHYNTVRFISGRVRNKANPADSRSAAYGDPGALSPTGLGGPLPLFNTVRVVFNDALGRPEQKYLRLPLNEANITNGILDGELVDFVQENYVNPMVAQTQYVGPNGEAHVSGLVITQIQNRQLGWHRRFRPGFHRGWVPN